MKLVSSIRYEFDERKTTAAAVYLLHKSNGRMPYMKLIKTLYLADRKSWESYGRPITGDRYVAMRYGPVLSNVLSLIRKDLGATETYWGAHIQTKGVAVEAVKAADLSRLSEAELGLLNAAWEFCGQLDQWKLSEWTHGFPEWHDPGKSAFDIDPEDILAALGTSDEAQDEARQLAVEKNYFDRLFGR